MSQQVSGSAPIQFHIRNAYFWTIIGSTSRYIASLGISLLLTRLLKPEDYGLIGMTTVFTELLGSIFEWSLGPAIIHFRETNPDRERPTYFTSAVFLGATFTTILLVTAPSIANFYHEPRLVLLLRVISLSFIIAGIRTVSGSILMRELRFKFLSFVDIFASLTAGLTAIMMAYMGFGVWSLVANLFLLTMLQAIAYAWKARPRFTLKMNREVLSGLWRYSAPLLGSGSLSKFYDNADYLVVGRILGPGPVGFYSVAFRLAMLINERISSVINRVAFPSFAKLRDDQSQVIGHWFAVTKRVTLITFPFLVWLGVNAEDFVRVVLGTRWLPAVVPLRFLCIMTAAKILTNIVYQVLQATGHPRVTLRYDVMTAITLPLAFLVGCKFGGLLGLGIAWCTVFPMVRFLLLLGARSVLCFRLRAYAENLFDPIVVSVVCAAFMLPAEFLLPSGILRLALGSSLWAAAMLLCVALSTNIRRLVLDTFSTFASAKAAAR
jgi:teichuronic acid exporter